MEEVIKLNAVDQYNKMFGLETLHPLVSVVDLSEATGYPRHFTLNYGVYALFLKNTKCGDIRYGKQFYDYQEGTVTSFAPGQVTEVNMLEGMQPSASGLLFHPDLIKGTSLGQGIKQYSFFSYSSTEALHLSEDEKEIFLDCLKKIKMEIQRPIDKHSKGLIARNIDLLLHVVDRDRIEEIINEEAREMETMAQSLRDAGVREVTVRMRTGRVPDEMDIYLKERRPSLVVLGAQGTGRCVCGRVGKTVYQVAQVAPCPVLVVPSGRPELPL